MYKHKTKETGKTAEDKVVEIMEGEGFRTLCRNYAVHNVGEIDSAFIRGDDLCIVEVRARHLIPGYPTPAETVTSSKRQKIIKTARYLINAYKLHEKNIYFLIGQVALDGDGLVQNVEFTPF